MINATALSRDPQRAFGILLLAYIICVPYLLWLFWQIKHGRAESKMGTINRKKDPGSFWALIGLQLLITTTFLVGSLVNFINQLRPVS
ncbi:hypothetical protein [Geothrix limicola]|uniref:hypothetical protein n=1 Tax=Geothrix limicola TaxID=2927978 RepID=UPI002552A9FD|nr:hypothetical protein [Geothrix limicola]